MVSGLTAMAILGASPSRLEKVRRMTCDPDTVAIGVWNRQPLCSNPRKKKLETIRYDIAQLGAEFDLSATHELATNLASASKTSIVPDKTDPNFVLLLISNDTSVDLEKALTSLNIEDAKFGAAEFKHSVHDYQQGIVEKTLTFGSQYEVLHRRDGQPVFVVVIVQKTPELPVFVASHILDNMMYALGLSVGTG